MTVSRLLPEPHEPAAFLHRSLQRGPGERDGGHHAGQHGRRQHWRHDLRRLASAGLRRDPANACTRKACFPPSSAAMAKATELRSSRQSPPSISASAIADRGPTPTITVTASGHVVTSTYAQNTNHLLTLAAQGAGNLFVLQAGLQNTPYEGFPNQQMDMAEIAPSFSTFVTGETSAGAFSTRACSGRTSGTR